MGNILLHLWLTRIRDALALANNNKIKKTRNDPIYLLVDGVGGGIGAVAVVDAAAVVVDDADVDGVSVDVSDDGTSDGVEYCISSWACAMSLSAS